MVGIAFIAAHARECFPFLYCSTCVAWQVAHVSGVGILTLATSLAEVGPFWSAFPTRRLESRRHRQVCSLPNRRASVPYEHNYCSFSFARCQNGKRTDATQLCS